MSEDMDKVPAQPDAVDQELFGMIDDVEAKDVRDAEFEKFSTEFIDFKVSMTHQQYDVLSHVAERTLMAAHMIGDDEAQDLLTRILLSLSAGHAEQFGAGDDTGQHQHDEEGHTHDD
jgi:hypothetical protein